MTERLERTRTEDDHDRRDRDHGDHDRGDRDHGDRAGHAAGDGAVARATSTGRTLDSIWRSYAEDMHRVAYSVLRDDALAQDIVQDSLLLVWRHLDQCRDASPRAWVLAITRNTAVSSLRRRRAAPIDPADLAETMVTPADELVDKIVENREALRALWFYLDSVDATSRAVLLLRGLQDLSYEAIGEQLGLETTTAKTRAFRTRRALGAVMRDWVEC